MIESDTGINCGAYGKARACRSCTLIYPEDSCQDDCGWFSDITHINYKCIPKGEKVV